MWTFFDISESVICVLKCFSANHKQRRSLVIHTASSWLVAARSVSHAAKKNETSTAMCLATVSLPTSPSTSQNSSTSILCSSSYLASSAKFWSLIRLSCATRSRKSLACSPSDGVVRLPFQHQHHRPILNLREAPTCNRGAEAHILWLLR